MYHDLTNVVNTAEQKGLAKGRAEGAQQEMLHHVRKMKAKGFYVEDIADVTGLSPQEIETLK